MEAVVIYDTTYDTTSGSTQQVAHAVGAALGERYWVHVLPVAAAGEIPPAIDLLVVGGPTHRHGASPAMRSFLDAVPHGALRGAWLRVRCVRRSPRWSTRSATWSAPSARPARPAPGLFS